MDDNRPTNAHSRVYGGMKPLTAAVLLAATLAGGARADKPVPKPSYDGYVVAADQSSDGKGWKRVVFALRK